MDYRSFKELSECAQGLREASLVLKGGRIINVFSGEIIEGSIAIENGMIVGIGDYAGTREVDLQGRYVSPGFIDAHLHFESALAHPLDLIYSAMRQGTTTFIVDPHEVANVAGGDGIDYILEQTSGVPASVFIMLPSCVPATKHEENGCHFTAERMLPYMKHPRVLGLGEVMDDNAILDAEPAMMEKLSLFGGRIKDGHAPGLTEKQLAAYALAKIKTDHECVSYDYAMNEIRNGMYVLVREASGAKNLEAIITGIVRNKTETSRFAFCTDDKHISDIEAEGHISLNIRKSIRLGLDPIQAIQMATVNPATCYRLDENGAVAPGYRADLVVLDDLQELKIHSVYCGGQLVDGTHDARRCPCPEKLLHTVHIPALTAQDIALPASGNETDLIGVMEDQLTTQHLRAVLPASGGFFLPSSEFSKAVVIERHKGTGHIGVAAVKGFGITNGAIGSTLSHDSHNMVIIGDNDASILAAARELQRVQGGYTIVEGEAVRGTLPLPVMGIMTQADSGEVESITHDMEALAHRMGVPPRVNPFTFLSFMALPVIPSLRITTKGLIDTQTQTLL